MEVDDLLPIVETAALLSFVKSERGDIELTLGEVSPGTVRLVTDAIRKAFCRRRPSRRSISLKTAITAQNSAHFELFFAEFRAFLHVFDVFLRAFRHLAGESQKGLRQAR